MPRAPRLDYPGALHHLVVRGIERRPIFLNDGDRRHFLDRLARPVLDSGSAIYAWALMPNHAHVLFRTGEVSLSQVARRWLGPYATTFNRVHRRAGHLFQNRFKNTLVEEETYLLELVRYIHLNPVRSRLPVTLDSLDRYAWTGHAVLLGYRHFEAQHTEFVLAHFANRIGDARSAYRLFVRDGMQRKDALDLEGGGLRRSAGGWEQLPKLGRGRERWTSDERILGGSEFARGVLARFQDAEMRLRRPVDPDRRLAALRARVARSFSLNEAEIASPTLRRDALAARALFSYVAVHRYGLTLTAVARELGLSVPSIARAVRRAETSLKDDAEAIEDPMG